MPVINTQIIERGRALCPERISLPETIHTFRRNCQNNLALLCATRSRESGWEPVMSQAKADVTMLQLLQLYQGNDGRHERINKRAALAALIERCAEDGKIAVVESGRDCDCVEYSGKVSIIEATARAFHAHEQGVAEWADGPFHLAIEKPSVARGIQAESRDLALEAYEDGHPHSVVSRFP